MNNKSPLSNKSTLKSKLQKLQKLPIVVKLKLILFQAKEQRVFALSSQLAYWILLSFFPFILLFLSLVPLFPIDYTSIIKELLINTPNYIQTFFNIFIKNFSNYSDSNYFLFSLGLIFATWSASTAVNTLIITLNSIHSTSTLRNGLYQRFYSLAITLLFIVVIFSSILTYTFLSAAITYLSTFININLSLTIRIVQFIIIPLVVFLFIFMLYQFSVNEKMKLKYTLPGSIFFTVSWFTFLFIFNLYLQNFNSYAKLYGVMGTFIILIMSFFYTAMFILIGAIINNTTFLEEKKKDTSNHE